MVSISRRTLAKGAAWSAPAVLATATVPAYAASSTCPESSYVWHVESIINTKNEDYSNTGFNKVVTLDSTPRGAAAMQHWASNGQLNWRLMLGFPDGAAPGTIISIPIDLSWNSPSKPVQLGLADFKRFGAVQPELYSHNLPAAAIDVLTEDIIIVITSEIPAGSAGGFVFTAQVDGGQEDIDKGVEFMAKAFINFLPIGCSQSTSNSVSTS